MDPYGRIYKLESEYTKQHDAPLIDAFARVVYCAVPVDKGAKEFIATPCPDVLEKP